MIKRYDLSDYDLQTYPQYYRDKYFVPKENGRFVLWEDVKYLLEDKSLNYQRCKCNFVGTQSECHVKNGNECMSPMTMCEFKEIVL